MEFVRGVLVIWGLIKLSRKGKAVSEAILRASETETVQVLMTLPKLPEGYEYTGELRPINHGESYVSDVHGRILTWRYTEASQNMHPVIRKYWQFPEDLRKILAPGWVTKDGDGFIFWWKEEPVWDPRNSEWNHVYDYGVEIDESAFPCLEEAPGGSSSIWKVGDHEEKGSDNG